MKTATLTKPDGTTFQVNDRRTKKLQTNFQILKGSVDTDNKPEEPLLPTGYERKEKEAEDVQSNKQEDEPLYPIGVNPK